jgi:hypothetical protein
VVRGANVLKLLIFLKPSSTDSLIFVRMNRVFLYFCFDNENKKANSDYGCCGFYWK